MSSSLSAHFVLLLGLLRSKDSPSPAPVPFRLPISDTASATSVVPTLIGAAGSGRLAEAAMMMRRVAASLVPPWLEPLLSTHFFTTCRFHPDAPRSESNLFCLDCGAASSSFCFYCRSDYHSGHRVIQIRRSSYHDVVRVTEIQKLLDIGGVQTYVINSAQVLFLNERPQPRAGRGGGSAGSGAPSSSSPHTCEICARSLLDPFRFCSLGCKLTGIKRNGDASFVLNPGDEESIGGIGGGQSSSAAAEEEVSKGGRRGRWGAGSRDGMGLETRAPAHPPSVPNSRRRKGIPHRSPSS